MRCESWCRSFAVLVFLWIGASCQTTNSSAPTSPNSSRAGEQEYLAAYQRYGADLDSATRQVAANCGTSVKPNTQCVVSTEDALDTDLKFLATLTDLTVPPRFTAANTTLTRALAHGARGFFLRIESLRDQSTAERDEAFSELSLTGQLLHAAFEAFPADVRSSA